MTAWGFTGWVAASASSFALPIGRVNDTLTDRNTNWKSSSSSPADSAVSLLMSIPKTVYCIVCLQWSHDHVAELIHGVNCVSWAYTSIQNITFTFRIYYRPILKQEPCCRRETVRRRVNFDICKAGGKLHTEDNCDRQSRENSHFRRLHSHLTPPQQRTPTNIGIKLISPETTKRFHPVNSI